MPTRLSRRTLSVLCLLALGHAHPGWAQGSDFPSRPITIVVPYPAGGIVDAITRILAEHAGRTLGQVINVDPRPGGNGNIGTQAALRAPADGYTWVFVATAFTVNPLLYKGLWDPLKDATGVGAPVLAPSLFAVPAGLPVKDIREFVDLARKQPGKLNFGNPGAGTSMHLNTELFRQSAGIDLASIPYKGQPPVLTDMVRGEVHFSVYSYGVAAPQITAGRIRPLAVVSDKRLPSLPDVPTLAEAGYPDANVVPWYGYVVHAATPRAVVSKINAALNAAIQAPEVQQKLLALGMQPLAPRSPEQIDAMIRADHDKFSVAVKAGNITPP